METSINRFRRILIETLSSIHLSCAEEHIDVTWPRSEQVRHINLVVYQGPGKLRKKRNQSTPNSVQVLVQG
jgi:hypothetical protein